MNQTTLFDAPDVQRMARLIAKTKGMSPEAARVAAAALLAMRDRKLVVPASTLPRTLTPRTP